MEKLLAKLKLKTTPESEAFTLLEVVIYIAVLSIIVGGITTLAFLIYRNQIWVEDRVQINEDMRVLIKSIRDDMYLGNDIDVPNESTLVISFPAGDDITYSLSSAQVFRRVGSNPPVAITADITNVSEFSIEDITTPDVAGTVRITLHLGNYPQGTLKPEVDQEITTTVSLKFL